MVDYKDERFILCIDLKSFYASCECVARGLDPFHVPLAVVGRLEEARSIVLAISPALKQEVFNHVVEYMNCKLTMMS